MILWNILLYFRGKGYFSVNNKKEEMVSEPLEIGEYRIIQKIGSGGVGCVYRAIERDRRAVALKILTNKDIEHINRFKKEFLLLKNINHPNIVKVFDFGYTPGGQPFFSMEFVRGKDFETYFKNVDYQKLGLIFSQICQVLEFLHTKEIIHGDLKPSNILITDDEIPRVKFTDFGFSEYQRGGDNLIWKGTIAYIAPEIIKGEEYNHQSDLYSLGATLYQVITKRLPFAENDLTDLATAHLDKEPEFPEGILIPENLKEVILKLLKKDQIDRYYSVGEIKLDLKDFISSSLQEDEILLGKSLLFSTQLVGREKELSFFKESYKEAQSGELKVVLLKGEFGVGKTRLLREFKALVQCDSGTLIWKNCSEVKTGFLGDIQSFVGNSYPLVFLIDDFQDVDLHLLDDFLNSVREAKSEKILICLVLENGLTTSDKDKKAFMVESKIDSALKANLSKINLEPLNLNQTKTFLNSGFRWRNPEGIGKLIHRWTGGNSLLITWVMTSSMKQGYLTRTDHFWGIKADGFIKVDLPEAYRKAIDQKLSRINPQDLNLLKVASVIGSETTLDLLAEVLGCARDRVKKDLEKILEENILKIKIVSSEEKFVFVNQLIRDYIYNRIPSEEKVNLHEVSGKILENKYSDNLEQIYFDLAYHFVKAKNKELGFKYSFLAGEKADNENNHMKALEHYQDILKLCESESDFSFASKEEILKNLASQYGSLGDFAKAIDCCNKALFLLKDKKEIEKTLDTYRQIGTFLLKKGETDRAIELLNESLSLTEDEKYNSKISMIYLTLGWAYRMKSDYTRAISYIKKSSKLSERWGDLGGLASAFNGIGVIYWSRGRFDKALKFFNQSLKIFEDLKDQRGLAKTYSNLGMVYRDKAKTLEAIDCFERSLSYLKEVGDVRDLSILYNNLALAYFSKCDWDESLAYQHKSLDLKEKIGDPKLIASSQNNLGLVYLRKGALNQAIIHFQKSMSFYRTLKDDHGIAFSYFNLGRIHILKEKWDKARELLNRSLKLKEKANDKIGIADVLILLGKISMGTGDLLKAEEEFKKSLRLFDSLKNKEETIEPTLNLALLKLRQHNPAEAEIFLSYSEKLLESVTNTPLEGMYYTISGLLLKEKDHQKESMERFLNAARLFRKLGMRYELGEVYLEIGKLKYELEKLREARGYLKEALNIFKSMELSSRISECKNLMDRVFRLTKSEKDRTEVLYQISDLLTNITDLEELLIKTLDLITEHLGAERAAIIFYNSEDDSLELKAATGIEPQTKQDALTISRKVIKDVIKTDAPLVIEDTRSDPEIGQYESVITYNILSILCVPLITRNKVLGAIYVDHRTLPGMFSKEDSDFLKAFANLVAVALEKAQIYSQLHEEVFQLKKDLKKTYSYPDIIGKSKKMQEVFHMIEKVANSKASVLLLGEHGTGKECIANLIYKTSSRKDQPFVKINCAALTESLLESELFGIEEKVATGVAGRDGKFKLADGGTIFFDEIADMSLITQAKVLRVLQEREFERVGGSDTVKVDIRVISATNKDLEECIRKGVFRKDLFYRINPVTIPIPPLRERKEDIPYLVDYFMEQYCREYKKPKLKIPTKVMSTLMEYPWPGNVRELEHFVQKGVLFSENEFIHTEHLPNRAQIQKQLRGFSSSKILAKAVATLEKEMITSALQKNNWNNVKAAYELDISEATLRRKSTKYKIRYPQKMPRQK